MDLNIIFAAVLSVCTVGFFAVLLKGLLSRKEAAHRISAEWLENFSTDRYRPMQRLLRQDDFRFLMAQGEAGRKAARKLRAERRRIFRAYLRSMTRDFTRITSVLQLSIASADRDRSELSMLLWREAFNFRYALFVVHIRLGLHATGMSVDTAQLVRSLDKLRIEMPLALPSAAAA